MPLQLSADLPTLLVRKEAFERAGLVRSAIDARLGLTPEEFVVEGGLIAIGPIHDDEALGALIAEMEEKGLEWFEDVFEMSGNWPEWLTVLVRAK